MLQYTESPFYTLYILYSLILLILAIIILIVESRNRDTLWKEQTLLLLVALAFPTVVNYLFVFGITPVPGINLTAPLLWIAAVLYTVALFRYRFLDIIPIARSRLIETMNTQMLVLDTDDRIIDMNPAACLLFSIPVNEAIGKPVSEIATDWPDFLSLCRSEGTGHSDLKRSKENGTRFYTGSIEPMYTLSGEPEGRLILLRDVTEQKRAEDSLQEEQQFSKLILDSLPGIFYLYTYPENKLVRWNKQYESILGYPAEEMRDHSSMDWFLPESRNAVQKTIETVMETGQGSVESFIVAKDGHRIPFFLTGVRFEAHGRLYYMGIGIDITDRERAEEALRNANKKLNLLSSISRHDINNQLLILNGFLDILHENVPDPALEDYFNRITKACSRISAMIRFTKEYEQIGVNAPAWQDVRNLVETAAGGIQLGAVMVKNDLPGGRELFADPLIVKVFYNLMDNAVRYGGKITTIRFSEEEHDGDHILVCEDDGDGIPTDEKEKIFERGFGKNTGLGLFLSREILAITGITIRETGEPGKGARFEMMVPKGMYRTKSQ